MSISLVKKMMQLIQNVSTCTQTDESFFITNNVPMNKYSRYCDLCEESDHEEYEWEGEDHCNVDEDEVENESIKNKYLLVEWSQWESLIKNCLVCGCKATILKTVSRRLLIKVRVKCEEHISEWTSQSFRNGVAEGNMALSAVIVLYLDTFHAVAKYGSNTIINAETSEVIDFFIEHFSNVMNSNGLGLYAFLKVFDYLLESGLEI